MTYINRRRQYRPKGNAIGGAVRAFAGLPSPQWYDRLSCACICRMTFPAMVRQRPSPRTQVSIPNVKLCRHRPMKVGVRTIPKRASPI